MPLKVTCRWRIGLVCKDSGTKLGPSFDLLLFETTNDIARFTVILQTRCVSLFSLFRHGQFGRCKMRKRKTGRFEKSTKSNESKDPKFSRSTFPRGMLWLDVSEGSTVVQSSFIIGHRLKLKRMYCRSTHRSFNRTIQS